MNEHILKFYLLPKKDKLHEFLYTFYPYFDLHYYMNYMTPQLYIRPSGSSELFIHNNTDYKQILKYKQEGQKDTSYVFSVETLIILENMHERIS